MCSSKCKKSLSFLCSNSVTWSNNYFFSERTPVLFCLLLSSYALHLMYQKFFRFYKMYFYKVCNGERQGHLIPSTSHQAILQNASAAGTSSQESSFTWHIFSICRKIGHLNMTNANKAMDSSQILQNLDRRKWTYSLNYCQMTCMTYMSSVVLCVSPRRNALQPFHVEIYIAQLQNTAHLTWPQTMSSQESHPIAPTLFRKLYPAVCEHPTRDFFIFVFSCWKAKADFKTETVSLLSLKIWSGAPPMQQCRLHF